MRGQHRQVPHSQGGVSPSIPWVSLTWTWPSQPSATILQRFHPNSCKHSCTYHFVHTYKNLSRHSKALLMESSNTSATRLSHGRVCGKMQRLLSRGSAVCLTGSHPTAPAFPEFSDSWPVHRTWGNSDTFSDIFRISLLNFSATSLQRRKI